MNRSLKENIWEMVPVCGVCGSESHTPLFSLHGKAYVKCTVCQIPRLYERIAPQNLDLLYGAYHRPQQELSTTELEEQLSNPTFAFRRKQLERYIPENKRQILEVGCGDGNFLAFLRRYGWQVDGTEFSAETTELIKKRHNITTRLGDFVSMEIAAASLEVLAAYHVLEHVYEPLTWLKSLKRTLKPNGFLHLQVPNYQCLDRYLTGICWTSWSFPQHVYFYSPGTLKTLLQKEGFEVLSIKTYDPWHSASTTLTSFRNLFRWLLLKRPPGIDDSGQLIVYSPSGQQPFAESESSSFTQGKKTRTQLFDTSIRPLTSALARMESWFGFGNIVDIIAKISPYS